MTTTVLRGASGEGDQVLAWRPAHSPAPRAHRRTWPDDDGAVEEHLVRRASAVVGWVAEPGHAWLALGQQAFTREQPAPRAKSTDAVVRVDERA